jgi:uncharacterized membrane protein
MWDLILVTGVSWAVVALIHLVSFPPMQIVVGLVAALLAPGYALLANLYPRGYEFSLLERLGLSLGVSLAVASIGGLLLSFSPWGITTNSISFSLAGLVSGLSLIALLLRWRLRSALSPSSRREGTASFPANPRNWPAARVGLVLLGVVIMGAVGYFLYREQALPPRQSFTEFALLDAKGGTQNYATKLAVGKPASYRVSVVNRERSGAEYRVQVWFLDHLQQEEVLTLSPGARLEQPISWVPPQSAQRAWLEFRLLRSGQQAAVRKAGLWVSVAK